MKEYSMSIKQTDVFDDVSAHTNYAGFKRTSDSSAFDRMATIDDNDEILTKFWDKSANQLVNLLSPFISSVAYSKTTSTSGGIVSGGSVVEGGQTVQTLALADGLNAQLPVVTTIPGLFITLNMSEMWDSTLLSACTSAAHNFLLAGVLEQWYRITDPESVAVQVSDQNAASTELRILLYSRKRPSFSSSFYGSSTN